MKKRVVLEIILFLVLCLLLVVVIRKMFFAPLQEDVVAEMVTYEDKDILGIKATWMGKTVYESVDPETQGRSEYQPGRFEQVIEHYKYEQTGKKDLSGIALSCTPSIKTYAENTEAADVIVLDPKDQCREDLVLLCFHGGGYLSGMSDFELRGFDEMASRCHARAYAPLYNTVFHGSYKEAYALFLDVYRDLCLRSEKVIVIGSSAGGGLALGFVEYLNEIGERIPDKMLLLCPWVDVTLTNPEISEYVMRDRCLGVYGLQELGKLWAGDLDPSDYRISPINGDFTKPMPETLLFTGTEEILRPDVELLYEKLKSNGHKVHMVIGEELYHVFMFSDLPEAKKAKEIEVDFLCDQMLFWKKD